MLAEHFDAISISAEDNLPAKYLQKLKEMNVRFILIRAAGYNNIDLGKAQSIGLRVAIIPKEQQPPLFVKDLLGQMAEKALYNINCWAKNKICKYELTEFRITKDAHTVLSV